MQKEIQWLLEEKYKSKPNKNFYKDIERLNQGEPLDYVIGFTEFLGCKIDLSKKPLIPRQETEFWVADVLKNVKLGGKALDIFSGSGCIGIALLKNTNTLLCDFADKEAQALSQIKANCILNKINKKKYKIIKSDIFSKIKGKYDYIFANPPYIAKTRMGKIQKSVLKFEPKEALFGGVDGLFYVRKILKEAKNHLNNNGKIFMEFDYIQRKDINELLRKYKYNSWEFKKDQHNRWRWVVAF